MSGVLSLPENPTGMEEGPSHPFEEHGDGEGEETLNEDEVDVIYQAKKLAMEQDKETDNEEDLSKDLEVDTESDQEGNDSKSDYNPSRIQASRRRPRVSHRHAGPSNSSKTSMCKQATKDAHEGSKQKSRNLGYEFCPIAHRPSIHHLLVKHFCKHPLLPEHHGQLQTAKLIHSDSVYESYLYCKNNHLCEVWAYLWTSWYSPDKGRLWARSAHPHAIPRK